MKINWTTYINSNVNSKLYNDYYYKSTYGRAISVKLLHLLIYVNLSFIEFLNVILLFFFLKLFLPHLLKRFRIPQVIWWSKITQTKRRRRIRQLEEKGRLFLQTKMYIYSKAGYTLMKKQCCTELLSVALFTNPTRQNKF